MVANIYQGDVQAKETHSKYERVATGAGRRVFSFILMDHENLFKNFDECSVNWNIQLNKAKLGCKSYQK